MIQLAPSCDCLEIHRRFSHKLKQNSKTIAHQILACFYHENATARFRDRTREKEKIDKEQEGNESVLSDKEKDEGRENEVKVKI